MASKETMHTPVSAEKTVEKAKTSLEIFREIQQSIKVKKGKFNAFSKFYYRSVEDIYEAWKALKTPLILTITDEIISVPSNRKDPTTGLTTTSTKVFVQATAKIIDTAGVIIGVAQAQAELGEGKAGMSSEQATGSASSYARKYALNGLFLLDDTEDPDATSGSTGKGKKKEVPEYDPVSNMKIHQLKVKELQDLIRGDKDKTARAMAILAGRSVVRLSLDEINEIIEAVR